LSGRKAAWSFSCTWESEPIAMPPEPASPSHPISTARRTSTRRTGRRGRSAWCTRSSFSTPARGARPAPRGGAPRAPPQRSAATVRATIAERAASPGASTLTVMEIVDLGVGSELVDYHRAWDLQRELHAAVAAGTRPDTLVLVEHESVYT